MRNFFVRVLPYMVATVAMIVGIISLVMSCQMSQELKKTASILDDVQQRIEAVAERTEVTFAVWSLWAVNWPEYIQACKIWATSQNPRLLEPLPQNDYKLTEEGRNLISSDDMKRLIEITEEDSNVAENDALLKFGVERLYLNAKDKGVKFEAMIGVFASYVQEIKQTP